MLASIFDSHQDVQVTSAYLTLTLSGRQIAYTLGRCSHEYAPAIGISYKDFTLGIVTDGNGPVPVLVRHHALYDQDRIVRYDGLNC